MGGGVKIAVNKSFNIILEYGARKTFTDYLDDVSTTYIGSPYPAPVDNQDFKDMSDQEICGFLKSDMTGGVSESLEEVYRSVPNWWEGVPASDE